MTSGDTNSSNEQPDVELLGRQHRPLVAGVRQIRATNSYPGWRRRTLSSGLFFPSQPSAINPDHISCVSRMSVVGVSRPTMDERGHLPQANRHRYELCRLVGVRRHQMDGPAHRGAMNSSHPVSSERRPRVGGCVGGFGQ